LNRRIQLGSGIIILIVTHVLLALASTIELAAVGAAFWGLQLAVTQGLLAASVADAAPDDRRATAFAIFDLAMGIATFIASAGAGLLWIVGGPSLTFWAGSCIALISMFVLLLAPRQTFMSKCASDAFDTSAAERNRSCSGFPKSR
jgi:predicted MFS family arabinose efflux permease